MNDSSDDTDGLDGHEPSVGNQTDYDHKQTAIAPTHDTSHSTAWCNIQHGGSSGST